MPESTPTPDPTVLTTEQLQREIGLVRELLAVQFATVGRVLEEKFATVDLQFALVERQRVEQKNDTRNAVDAALTAQKEAVREQTIASERAIAKSEASTSKQLEQLSLQFAAAISNSTDKIGALERRVGTAEDIRTGGKQAYAAIYVFVGALVGLIPALGIFALK